MRHGFTSGGQKSGSVFSAALIVLNTGKEALHLVLTTSGERQKKLLLSQSERSTVQVALDHTFVLRN